MRGGVRRCPSKRKNVRRGREEGTGRGGGARGEGEGGIGGEASERDDGVSKSKMDRTLDGSWIEVGKEVC